MWETPKGNNNTLHSELPTMGAEIGDTSELLILVLPVTMIIPQ